MKSISFLVGGLMLIGLVGCTRSSPSGGGGERATKFTIDGPAMAPTIKQGESQNVALTINRGKEFKQPVKLNVKAPAGIEAVLSDEAVAPAEKSDVNLKVAIGAAAAPGEHIIQVTGTPDAGAATTLDLRVKVAERSSKAVADGVTLNLRVPATATTIKQGETKTVKISVEPNAKYLNTVNLKAEAPKGLKAEMTNEAVKAATGSEAQLKITADKDAPVGDHTIRIMATAEAATVSPGEVRVKVIAP